MFRSLLGWIVFGLLVGDGLALMGLSVIMFKLRNQNRSFVFLTLLFASMGVFLLFWLSAWGAIPVEARTSEYKVRCFIGLVLLAVGTWPVYLHLQFQFWMNGQPPITKLEGGLK